MTGTSGPSAAQTSARVLMDPQPIMARGGPGRSQRVLACVLCQQRKIKCDRRFPCANCIKGKAVCVPATQNTRQRRRRFPERDLLERIRHYESLLRQNNVVFEPLHKEAVTSHCPPKSPGVTDSQQNQTGSGTLCKSSPASTAAKSEIHEPPKDFWHAMSHGYGSSDCESDCSDNGKESKDMVNNWNQLFLENDHPFFGRSSAIDLSPLHPEPIQIFKLWQSYLENVNPLLKVSHTPTLQGRVINAAGSIANVDPNLEVLMFGIYCVSALSVGNDYEQVFGESKESLLSRYQFGCQQALLNAAFLRTTNLECLTGFFLYLVTMRPMMHPCSLSSLLGVAVRTAQRIGLHKEASYANCAVFEGEVRRRLWWSIVTFDARIGELADMKTSSLDPTWDCRVPFNVNDSDLQPAMIEQPTIHTASTDAIFAIVRYELADFVRHALFHLDFTSPVLKPLARNASNNISQSDSVQAFATFIQEKYLKFCDTRIPLHFMTLWTAKATLAKYSLYSNMADSSTTQSAAQRDVMVSHALTWIESDTMILASPLTKGFTWLIDAYFPLPAYIRIFNDLRRRPTNPDAARCWQVVSDHYACRTGFNGRLDETFLRLFTNMVLQPWQLREAALIEQGHAVVEPDIVTRLKRDFGRIIGEGMEIGDESSTGNIVANDLESSILTEFGGPGLQHDNTPLDPNMATTDSGGKRGSGNSGNAWSPLDWNFVDTPEGHFLY